MYTVSTHEICSLFYQIGGRKPPNKIFPLVLELILDCNNQCSRAFLYLQTPLSGSVHIGKILKFFFNLDPHTSLCSQSTFYSLL